MNYYIITYGCQMNKSDSERIAAVLEKINLRPSKTEDEADLIIINMCSVRQKSVDKVFRKIENLRQKNKKAKIYLTGCVLEKDKKIFKKITDGIFKIDELQNLPKILKQTVDNKPQTTHYLKIVPKYSNKDFAYVPIMTGCNNFCAYCVVPYTRGREISRAPEDIIKEIKCLLKKGYKTIWLLGQNVNSYKFSNNYQIKSNTSRINSRKIRGDSNKIREIITFPKLLQKIEKIPGNFEIGFLTSHPKDFSDELIETIASSKKIKKYIHLPVQAGSDKILKKMNRGYTKKDYLKLVEKIKKKIPDVELSTDIIVGFPGETKKDFNETVDVVKKVGFKKAYIACYSPRPGTKAEKLKDNIPQKEKERREKALREIIKKINNS